MLQNKSNSTERITPLVKMYKVKKIVIYSQLHINKIFVIVLYLELRFLIWFRWMRTGRAPERTEYIDSTWAIYIYKSIQRSQRTEILEPLPMHEVWWNLAVKSFQQSKTQKFPRIFWRYYELNMSHLKIFRRGNFFAKFIWFPYYALSKNIYIFFYSIVFN